MAGKFFGAQPLRALSVALFISASTLSWTTGSASSSAMPEIVTSKLAEGSDGLSNLWSDGVRLPVIVEFPMPTLPDPAAFDSPQEADAAHTRAIRAVQDAILVDLLGSPAGIANAEASPGTNLKRMAFSPMFGIVATADEVEQLAADPRVVRIHEDGLSYPSLIETLPLIGMPAAYAQGATGNNSRVAVLDTGARRSHEFLSSRIVAAACFSSTTGAPNNSTSLCPEGANESTTLDSANDCDSATIYGCGHGTHVSGIAAGFNTNQQAGEPPHGVARNALIVSINVFSQFPRSACGSLPTQYTGGCVASFVSDQIRGLEHVYTLRNTARIDAVNMSLGGGRFFDYCDEDARKPIIDLLLRQPGTATVIAAGNNGYSNSVAAPACISSAVTVASSTKQDARSSFSNWGHMIDLVAPGTSILAPYVDGDSDTGYASLSGTSMAAPHVAGAMAALRSRYPGEFLFKANWAFELSGLSITSSGVTKPRIRVPEAVAMMEGEQNFAPVNDNFADRLTIPGFGRAYGRNSLATVESGEPDHDNSDSINSGRSVWWRFTPASSSSITIDTLGSDFFTVLAVYTGNSVTNLTRVASNVFIPGNSRSRVTFNATAGTSYAIAVASYDASIGGSVVLNVAPTIPPPPNDNFADRIAIAGPSTVTGTNKLATSEPSEPAHDRISGTRDSVWWRFTPTATGPIEINTFGSNFDTVLAVYTGNTVSNLTSVASNNDSSGGRQSKVTFEGTAGTAYAIAVASRFAGEGGDIALTVQGGSEPSETAIVSAVTPVTRATAVGSTVTAYATIINYGGATATSCSIAVQPDDPLTFSYRARDHVTRELGPLNTPVSIPAGGRQDFLMAFTPTASMQQQLLLVFDCTNTQPAPVIIGLNTFLLVATSSAPPADIISTAVTSSNDGITNIPLGGTGFAALAAENIGTSATITAQVSASQIQLARSSLPGGTLRLCRTDPTTGDCLANPTTSPISFAPLPDEIVTFTAFVESDGTAIPFNPAGTRLFVNFFQGTTPVGSASVAVRTVAPAPDDTAALMD
jgi:subtilisin family serine protease